MLAVVALAAATLSACAPTPEPDPTLAAAFASEDEAFATAEEVYREYLLAEDQRGNEEEGVDPRDYLTGVALQADIETQREFDSQGIRIIGTTQLASFEGLSAKIDGIAKIEATICLDVSDSHVINSAQRDVTPADSEDRWELTVTFVGTIEELLISDSTTEATGRC